jgi:hypothetical protein
MVDKGDTKVKEVMVARGVTSRVASRVASRVVMVAREGTNKVGTHSRVDMAAEEDTLGLPSSLARDSTKAVTLLPRNRLRRFQAVLRQPVINAECQTQISI